MKLYNQLSKKIENFRPENPENLKIYTCGPTVYSFAHIGNLASYIYWDFLIRTLTLDGYKVNRVLNLTDVGHLTSDADSGEDKLEKGAKREGKTVWEIADFYINAFLKDFYALNLVKPSKICRATDYIKEDIDLVNRLTEKGYTYTTKDGIYFDTSRFPRYADFAGLDLSALKAGARIALSSEKRNISDFAVWKFIKPGEDHAMNWEYLGQPGYPGWHLECATISKTELGLPLDIHTGGIDHIPVHHTNEIAEAESAYDTQLSRFWLHCNFLMVDGEKISKSLGNIYTLTDLTQKGFSPLDFKLWILQGHYQSERNFTFESLKGAKTRRLHWRNRIAKLYQFTNHAENSVKAKNHALAATNDADSYSHTDKLRDSILTNANDNLNSSKILALIDEHELSFADWRFVDNLLGLNLIETSPNLESELRPLINEREKARNEKDYETADKIRTDLAQKNIIIEDTPAGPLWQYST